MSTNSRHYLGLIDELAARLGNALAVQTDVRVPADLDRLVDAAVAEAPRLGGSGCIPAQDIQNVGRFAGIMSPASVMFYAITYAR